MPKVTVHLLRHGEVFNPGGVLYGRLPKFHLSDRGVSMAVLAAEHFRAMADDGAEFGYLAASPLSRAQETAQPTATALDLEIRTDDRLLEAENFFEGSKVTPAALLRPENMLRLYNPFRPSWGEPYAEQVKRMRQAVDSARRQAFEAVGDGAHAILVSHQLPIWILRLSAEGRRLAHDPRRRQCSLASVTSLRFENGRLVDVSYQEPAASMLSGSSGPPGA
ncbi:histidine phosphatase family protein [Acaricomes phytoseiuli]|uniref:histidine phosphatase family protein n=1 Tax=Acaricomes phytoseiuli TaxID=291968 RepID=UPI000476B59F|nr:histidine phosphatase family protein [Acaricomes phytoseiuli]MCW1250052.1 histidine phosphatase family protein [Acaricomes phytoseiuli]